MNNWLVRGLLLALLLCSAATKATSQNDVGGNVHIEEAVRNFMISRGFSFKRTIDVDGELLTPMVFDAPSCGRPLQVAPTSRNFQARTLFDHVGAAGDARFFAYLGLITQREESRGMFIEHLKQRALELLGLSSYELDSMMVVISEPAGCDIASRIDWSTLWKKDFRSHIAKDKLASREDATATP
ncbi:MAG TPA: hypothetical protein VIF61_02495 [Methylocystis sp.]